MIQQVETTSSPIPDLELIERILDGEKGLFELLIRRYNQRLYRIGMAILAHEMDVEDAMQTTYINAYQHLSQFERRASFSTWLTRIMLNQCYEQKRRNQQLKSHSEQADQFINMKTPATILVNQELNTALELAIEQLPDKYRLVFMLREIEELSIRETSLALSIEEANVKVRLNRAKAMLRTILTDYMKDHVYSFHLVRCDRIADQVMNIVYSGLSQG